MGFSYNHLGLCCDFCNNAGSRGNVRKISCPYGYCQAWACCTNCKQKKRHLQSSCINVPTSHKDYCKQKSIEFDNEQLSKALMEIQI